MLASSRVHPANYEKPASMEPTERTHSYQVGDENEDDARTTDKAKEVEVVGKRRDVLSSRSLFLAIITFVSFMSIITFVLTALMVSGKIGNSCNCSDAVGGNQEKQGSVLSSLMDKHLNY